MLLLANCESTSGRTEPGRAANPPDGTPGSEPVAPAPVVPIPTRRPFEPGELVEYIALSGDTLPALAGRFNTTVAEIRSANPGIPEDATTMPPGMPMRIPIYFRTLWGSPFRILPDNAFVNGPAGIGFNTAAFVDAHPGWLGDYSDYPSELGGTRARARLSGAAIVDHVATNYSLSPRLLLAILEYQGGALSLPDPPVARNVLGHRRLYYGSPYLHWSGGQHSQ
jgi:phage tail protein X